jgi:hypothetical protein
MEQVTDETNMLRVQSIPSRVEKPEKIRLICPICGETGKIEVDKSLLHEMIQHSKDSLIEVQVFKDEVCNHEFTIRVDARLKAR